MGEVQGGDRRLADIGVSLPRQRAEPGIDGVDRLDHGGEVPALHDLLDQAQLLVGAARVLVPDDEGRRDIGLARDIGAELLQAMSASAALLAASVSTSADCSLVITSFRIAAMDLRLANHWRRMRATIRAASVLSIRIARVAQR